MFNQSKLIQMQDKKYQIRISYGSRSKKIADPEDRYQSHLLLFRQGPVALPVESLLFGDAPSAGAVGDEVADLAAGPTTAVVGRGAVRQLTRVKEIVLKKKRKIKSQLHICQRKKY